MVKLDEITRTSTFAWSSDNLPLLATGTVAGAVDANFNSSSSVELWDIFSATNNKEPIFSAPVENRFYALAWSKPFEGRPKGLLAGAFENGVVEFWDAETLIKSKDLEKASVHKSSKHSGPVKSLQFNPNQNHVLVTGGSNGEIFIWDTKSFNEPFAPGKVMTPMDEITSVAWNNSVSHIFASTGNGGYTSIWDLKSKREVLHLSYAGSTGRVNFSHVAWHPTQSTKLITASDNDSCPVILTWDLRNSNAPEKVLEGHKKGVLSLDWCKQDPELLISSGKDNSTLLWNPIKGEKLGEYPTTANWAFQTRFAPAAPDIFATASFDGKIIVQSLQDTSPPVSTKVSSNDDNVFWNELSTTDTQQPEFVIKQAPEWLKCPSSVSFGFGSKLVSIKKGNDGKSVINIQKFVTTSQGSSKALFEALKNNDFKSIIDSKLEHNFVNDSDKSDWEILKQLSDSGKDNLFNIEVNEDQEKIEQDDKEADGEDRPHTSATDDSFFEKLGNGSLVSDEFVPQGSFKIFNSNHSESERKLIKLVLNNKIEEAASSCLEQGKLIEALILALDAPENVKQKVKTAFFKKNSGDEFARVLYNVSSSNVMDIVSNADVENWKEIAASISSFVTDPNEFNNKITELGDRIFDSATTKDDRDNAILCYLAGNALDKISSIWLKELPEFEIELLKSKNSNISSPSDARFEALKNFVEKIVAYRSISNISGELSGPSVEPVAKAILEYTNIVAGYGEFELADKFLQFLPSDIADTEKDRVTKASGVSAASNVSASATTASKTSTTKGAYGRSNVTPITSHYNSYVPPVPNSVVSPQPPTAKLFAPASQTNNAPPIPTPTPVTTNPYGRTIPSSNPYAPQHVNPYKPAAPADSAIPVSNTLPPPPPGPAKPSYKHETEGWNDIPDTFKPKAAAQRRAAAVATASPSPTPYSGTPQPPAALPKRTSVVPPSGSTLPPPPKGVSRTGSRTSVTPQSPQPIISSPRSAPVHINNRYAPPPGTTTDTSTVPPQSNVSIASPITNIAPAPSTVAPSISHPKNPYAPQVVASPVKNPYAPPPIPKQNVGTANSLNSPTLTKSTIAPPKNPYAPPPSTSIASSAPSVTSIPPPSKAGGIIPPTQQFGQTPPQPPGINQQPPASIPTEPEKPKYPKGDRSHIPENTLPIYQSLNNILEAVKPNVPEKYTMHAHDMEKRLNILFDHLNNDDLLSNAAVRSLNEVCKALEARDFATAAALNVEIATNHSDEIGQWHTGVKRLITMAEAMY